MDPKDFDKILKSKLEGLNSTSTPVPNWDRMEHDLDVDSQKDQIFDEQVKRKLEQLTVSKYASSNWSTLYQLVNNRIIKKRAVLFSKAAEFSIFALFLLGFSQLGWFDEYKDQVHFASSFEQTEQEKPFDVSQQGKEELASAKRVQNESALNNEEVIASAESFAILDLDSNSTSNEKATVSAVSTVQEYQVPVVAKTESLNIIQAKTSHVASHILPAMKTAVAEEKIEIQKPQLLFAANKNDFSPVTLDSELKKKKTRFYAEVGVDMAYASINSALRSSGSRNDVEIQKTTNKLYPVSYLKTGVDLGAISVNTGIEYQSIAYDPNVIHLSGEVSGIITNSDIYEISYDVVSVPLNIAWKLASYKTWDFKLNTGVVSNFITNTNYSISQQKSSGERVTVVASNDVDFSVLPPLPAGYFDEPRNERNVSSLLYASKSYFQSRAGIEVSKKLNQKTSIIANMNYNYQLPSFNAGAQDAINNYTIGLSVRRYLG